MELLTEFNQIGLERPPYFIAEIGLNHNGELNLAERMVAAAAEAGASAVKFQLYRSADFISRQPGGEDPDATIRFFQKFELTDEEWRKLASCARQHKVDFFCSIFDRSSLQLYRQLEPKLIKIASGDMNNRLLIEDALELNLPLLISTGAANCDEVDRMVSWLPAGHPLLLFQCVSAYPASIGDFNLSLFEEWRKRYNCLTGLSDHSPGNTVAIAAAALGANVIERHFTIDQNLPGPDHKLSLLPHEFKSMTGEISELLGALKQREQQPHASEEPVRRLGRRALHTARHLSANRVITREDLIALRPGENGIAPDEYQKVVGKRLTVDLNAGELITWELLSD